MKKVVLELTLDTARIVARACEFYSRVRNGQYTEIDYELRHYPHERLRYNKANTSAVEKSLELLKALTHPNLNPYMNYGVGGDHDSDVAWETFTTIQNALAWNSQPEGGDGDEFRSPMSYSGEPMPKCWIGIGDDDCTVLTRRMYKYAKETDAQDKER